MDGSTETYLAKRRYARKGVPLCSLVEEGLKIFMESGGDTARVGCF